MPSGQILTRTSIIRGLELELQEHSIRADLVVLPMTEFDLILSIDWMTVIGASIDFRQRKVSVKPSEDDPFIFFASQSCSTSHVISFVRARKLLRRRCQGFLASVVAVSEPPTRSMAEIEVVCDFPDVFSDDVARIPPGSEVEFSIELMPDCVPIPKAP
ncbi:uncharacterized protein [Henckelia pumila]|uniref:uncharacterized protein n=1 Tax=Henckelia pumila TaxID=405737 RepID=UPI003C6E8A69